LVNRDLVDILKGDIVKKDDFVTSAYLTTVVAVVPRATVEEWEDDYVLWNDYVVPGSLRQFPIIEGGDGLTLWRVVVLNSSTTCRQHKVTIRQFDYKPKESEERDIQRKVLTDEIEAQTTELVDSCGVYFSDMYSSYIHLKVLKLIIDAILRFGVKDNIFFCVIKPNDSKEKKIHGGLTKLFSDAESVQMYGAKEEIDDTEDFFPYATVPINIP